MSLAPVRVERDGDVAVIVIDNPPVNAGSAAVRQGLLDAVAQIAADPAVVAGVLIGAGGSFISGSDVSEFGKPLQPPELPAVIAAIEACAKPIVAALDGAALGGGYELALGCDARIAKADAMIGLPEVTLGMIPGAGGTQRLPRLVGIVRAIALICAGTRVAGTQAAAWGMVDAVAGGDLRADAVAMARALLGKQPVSARAVPPEGAEAVDAAVQSALRAERGRPAVIAAIEAVRDAGRLPFKMALAAERAVFTQLRLSGEAAALRHLFFAERRAGRWPGTAAARELSQAGVIGAGTMGAGIAAALLQAGLAVTLVDLADAALGRGVAAIDGIIARWHTAGRLTETQARELRGRLVTATLVDALAHCDVVIEAVVEDAGVKASLFATLDSVVSAETLIASNTSYLDLDALAAGTRDPGRVLGLHFFNPAQTMRLLEVVRGAATRDEAVATGLALSRRMGKQAVIARVGPGFIGNRIYAAYRRQCEFMIEDGAWPEQVDAALESFGFAMGPFATGDLSGLDIAWAMRRAGAASRDPAQRYVAIPDRLCEAGRLGRKTGAGWYAYPAGARRGVADPAVRDIILAESAARGIARRAFEDAEIVARVLVTMLNEAALLLSEGVAERASDIDVAFVHGYGFPRHQGGPLFWASRQEDAFLHRTRDAIGAATGAGFRVGDIDAVLTALRTGMNR